MHNRILFFTATSLLLACAAARAHADDGSGERKQLERGADAVLERATTEYRWFHQNPELSHAETRTAARLAAVLREIGLEVHEGVGGTGVVAILRSDKNPGKRVVLYRSDMDGLPVEEQTGLDYASKNKGVMHACGHDIHMSTAIGTLSLLAARKGSFEGTILFIGQPAEERGTGAVAMLKDPRLKKILKAVGKPAVALALHDAADLPVGQVSVVPKHAYSNVDTVDITVFGRGGHGAHPEATVDPVVMGAELVLSLQTVVSRRIAGNESAVITVGKFAAGTKHNIISDKAELAITVRSYSDETRALLLKEIERVADGITRAYGAPRKPEVKVSADFVPAVFNDPVWTERLQRRFAALLGADNVVADQPEMVGEDFAFFARDLGIPGVLYNLGAVEPARFKKSRGKGLPSLHSSAWAPDYKPAIRVGIITMSGAILDALR